MCTQIIDRLSASLAIGYDVSRTIYRRRVICKIGRFNAAFESGRELVYNYAARSRYSLRYAKMAGSLSQVSAITRDTAM